MQNSKTLIERTLSFPLLVTPTVSTKVLIASAVYLKNKNDIYPFLLRPFMVNSLGSSQPLTYLPTTS